MRLPFLTMPDPATSGEGALDPLGLSIVGERLAEQILPGLRARMSRPRFLTAMALSAVICEGLEDHLASDGVTPAYLIFEWLVAGAFVRSSERESTRGTPGTLKAQAAKDSGEPMSARTYLRVPTIFGFHGVYKALARELEIVDDDLCLSENGASLLKVWEEEQNLPGFLKSSVDSGWGNKVRHLLRAAVDDGLRDGCAKRSGAWQGWALLFEHLAPGKIGTKEAAVTYRLLRSGKSDTRGEIFHLLEGAPLGNIPESEIVKEILIPQASKELANRLCTISDFEHVAALLERSFDWIRYLSSISGDRAISASDFASEPDVSEIASGLPAAFARAEASLVNSPLPIQKEFAKLARSFDRVNKPELLFEAILGHHHEIQQAKLPEGKRDWFELAADGSAYVRVPYRLRRRVEIRKEWNRPYRISAARSFWADLQIGFHEPT